MIYQPELEIQASVTIGFSNIGYRVLIIVSENTYQDDNWHKKELLFKFIETGNKDSANKMLNEISEFLTTKMLGNFTFENKRGTIEFKLSNTSPSINDYYKGLVNNISLDSLKTSFSHVIIQFKEKHIDRFFIAKNPNDAENIYLQVLTERKQDGFYKYDPKNQILIDKAIEHQSGRLAYRCLQVHASSEYENFEIIDPEEIITKTNNDTNKDAKTPEESAC